jgi:hypothetical protein
MITSFIVRYPDEGAIVGNLRRVIKFHDRTPSGPSPSLRHHFLKVSAPHPWPKEVVDAWLKKSGVSDGNVLRQFLKGGILQSPGVTANVVWYAVKQCAGQAGINNLTPHDLRRTLRRLCRGSGTNWNRFSFCLATHLCRLRNGTLEANRNFKTQ